MRLVHECVYLVAGWFFSQTTVGRNAATDLTSLRVMDKMRKFAS